MGKSKAYRDYAVLTYRLHLLRDDDDSAESESIRDESDVIWQKLTEKEKDELGQFSANLYIVEEDYLKKV